MVSIKPDKLLLDTRINPLPSCSPTLKHYRYLFQETAVPPLDLEHTVVVTVGATALSLVCSILIGYALGRFRFRGGNSLGISIFLLYLVPPTLLFIPLSQIVSGFGLYNTLLGADPHLSHLSHPVRILVADGVFPHDLARAGGRGAGGRRDPLAGDAPHRAAAGDPGVLSAGIFCFTLAWNEFLYALVFMGSGDMKTVPVGVVSDLIRADVYFWGSLMAAGILGSVPVAIAYAFLVDNYVSGLTAGATKG